MTYIERVTRVREYLWTLELLGEVLINNDSFTGSIPEPQLTVRTTGGIHDAIKIIAGHAGEECSLLLAEMDA